MKYYLVKSNVNWADEIDLDGFDIFTEEELEKIKKELALAENVKTVSIGSNEEVEISPDEIIEELEEADEISKDAFMIIRNKLGEHFGYTKYILYFN
jgi:hypothetical protein